MDWDTFKKLYKLEYGNSEFWNKVLTDMQLNMKQIDKIYDWVAKMFIVRHQKLSERFIRKHAEDIGLNWCSIYQTLSEDFMREYADQLNWVGISVNQHLSENFIEEFADKVDWNFILIHQTLTKQFRRKHKDRKMWDRNGC